jgi:hypothetical protein
MKNKIALELWLALDCRARRIQIVRVNGFSLDTLWCSFVPFVVN